eukprot:5772804-Lingulodinium_polyedra.AAC.1
MRDAGLPKGTVNASERFVRRGRRAPSAMHLLALRPLSLGCGLLIQDAGTTLSPRTTPKI